MSRIEHAVEHCVSPGRMGEFPHHDAPDRPKCRECDTPLVCAESVKIGMCRVCRPKNSARTRELKGCWDEL